MMPIYEYVCHECGTTVEIIKTISRRDEAPKCYLGHDTERIVSAPVMQAWNPDRPFPNAVHFGDGKFPTKVAYEAHLRANDMAETRHDGKVYRPHGNKVVRVIP